eukprot:TRINITY_DN187_c0_g1_i1.p1 TRINITY_DN187_c0_g1~~TRINITY_DN187_c0_g1_i1.p1  ORF type:complete len:563 (+),score=125.05 TRINITY_DN187_c0_g1_i1:50-1738(+)
MADNFTSNAAISYSRLLNNDADFTRCDFRYSDLTEDNIKNIANVLISNDHCKALLLSGNDLSLEGIVLLSKCFLVNECLEEVECKFCDLTDESSQILFSCLKERSKPMKIVLDLGNRNLSQHIIAEFQELYEQKCRGDDLPKIVDNVPASENESPSPDKKRKLKRQKSHDRRGRRKDKRYSSKKKEDSLSASAPIKRKRSRSPSRRNSLSDVDQYDDILGQWAQKEISDKVIEQTLDLLSKNRDEAAQFLKNLHMRMNNNGDSITTKRRSRLAMSMSENKKKVVDLSRLVINEKIAETGGSNAGVFSCYIDGWNCVMKQLDLTNYQDSIESFESEIELLENLPPHPNISRYLYHERKGDNLRLFMTRYSCSLAEYLSKYKLEVNEGRQSYFSPSQVSNFCIQIVRGIEFLHKKNIIHRDLKTQNIFVTFDEHKEIRQLVIGDFDTAKRLSKSVQATTLIGTLVFMAPEVIRAQEDGAYDLKADVWSFGMILFELLTLSTPFGGAEPMKVAEKISSGHGPDLPELPEEYDEIVKVYHKCTKSHPEDRPSIRSLKRMLEKIIVY